MLLEIVGIDLVENGIALLGFHVTWISDDGTHILLEKHVGKCNNEMKHEHMTCPCGWVGI